MIIFIRIIQFFIKALVYFFNLAISFFNWNMKHVHQNTEKQYDDFKDPKNKSVIEVEVITEEDSRLPKDFFRQKHL